MKPPSLWPWLALALALRVISAFTHSNWTYPDEWYQTAELGNILSQGVGFYTQEVGLHLRNLTWPTLLVFPLKISEWFFPQQIGSGVILVQLFSGLLDLAMIWGWWQLIQSLGERFTLSKRWKLFGMALLVLPFFTISDSVSPSAEHISSVLIWVSLGFLARGWWFRAGFFLVAVAAVKYPCGLIALPLVAFSYVWRTRLTDKNPTGVTSLRRGSRGQLVWGLVAGLLLFGTYDWMLYGRPWESLWMYLQYNLFTGQGAQSFGTQSASVYLDLLTSHWKPLALPLLGIPLLFASFWGLYRGIRVMEPWSFAILTYGIAHLLIGHKEARFFLPIEGLMIWSAFYGLTILRADYFKIWSSHFHFSRPLGKGLALVGVLVFLSNGLLSLRALWGETWSAYGTYFELTRHLKENPSTCAVLTVRSPLNASLLPKELPQASGQPSRSLTPPKFPAIPIAEFPIQRRADTIAELRHETLSWLEAPPQCTPEQTLLIHLYRPHPYWTEKGCSLLRSGALTRLPESRHQWALENDWIRGPWYRCPSSVLKSFEIQKTLPVLTYQFGLIQKLPSYGVSANELVELGRQTSPPPKYLQ